MSARVLGYPGDVWERRQHEEIGPVEIEGTAEVRGREATVVWTSSGMVGDAELSRRLERAAGSKITSPTDFLRALRLVKASLHVGDA